MGQNSLPTRLYRKRRTATARRCRFESLESRELMAVDSLQIDSNRIDSTHFLVQFQPTATPSAIVGTSVAGATITKQVSSDGWYQATLGAGANMSSAMQAYAGLSNVIMAAPDFQVQLTATPNDPSYANQWALENNGSAGLTDADIDASQAWNYGTTSSTIVAVIDTGIDYNHVDLASNIWNNSREISGNGIDDDRNGYVDDTRGWNFAANNNNPMDDNGHGTHVAGTIGAVGNNGIGVSGVAWNVKMMALKFLDSSGGGALSGAIAAIDYARLNGAKIINASWGGGGFSTALQSAITRFQSAGGIFVAAAGNESANNVTTASYPANYSNVISVAASTSTDALASFSNYGTNVDIAAPGQAILSTIPGNRYATYSGTSMATPHVSGALALLWGQSPSLTSAQLVDLVMRNTDAVLTNRTTYGRLNVGKAAAALNAGSGGGQTDTTGPSVTTAVWNQTSGALTSVDITFSEAMRSTTIVPSAFSITGPSGAVAVTSVSLISGTTYRVSFASQSGIGKYTVIVLPTVADANGNLLNQDLDTVNGEAIQDRFSNETTLSTSRNYTRTGPFALQDATTTRVGVINVAIDVADSFSISDLNVNVSIDHTYVSDLRLRLIGPDGTSVILVSRRGSSRDNIRVTFDDEAASSIATATGDLNGTFKPERTLSAFDGKNAQGRWILEIIDYARQDTGQLNSVQLQFGSSVAAASTSAASGTASVAGWLGGLLDDWLKRLAAGR